MVTGKLIKADGQEYSYRPNFGIHFVDDEIEFYVGGTFRYIPLYDHSAEYCGVYVNIDAEVAALPVNEKATQLLEKVEEFCGKKVFGDVLLYIEGEK